MSQMTEIENKIVSQLVYLDIPENSKIDKKSDRLKSITVKQLLEYYQTPDGQERLKNRFKDEEELTRWNAFINGKSEDLSKYTDWKITNVESKNKKEESGFVAYTFEPAPGQAVVAFRGSEPMEDPEYRNDWKNNFSSVYADETIQQADAKAYLDKYMNNYTQITMTGHSLGGNLALFASITADEQIRNRITHVSTYNAPGFNAEFLDDHSNAIEAMKPRIEEFQNKYDIVSSFLYNPTIPIIIETSSKSYKGYDLINHGLPFFDMENGLIVENGKFKRSDPQEKDDFCHAISDITKRLQKLPDPVLKGIVNPVFAVWNDRFDYVDVLAGLTIAAYGPTAVITAVVSVVAVIVLPELMKYVIMPAVEKGIDAVEEVVKIAVDETLKFINQVFDRTSLFIGNKIDELKQALLKEMEMVFTVFIVFKALFGSRKRSHPQHPILDVHTGQLRHFATRMQMIQHKIVQVDRRLDTLAGLVDLKNLVDVVMLDLKIGHDHRLQRCMEYLNRTADRLEDCEQKLVRKALAL